MNSLLRMIMAGLLLLAASPSLRAFDGSIEYMFDLPFGATTVTPAWLGHPQTPTGPFATLDLPITPPDANASLLVTVFFQEKSGGFLRIGWQSTAVMPTNPGDLPGPGEASASAVLCDNFYEGIGMNNQRSLLVSADTMKSPGALHFQCGDTTLGISRIKLEWLQNSTGLTSPAITDTLVTPANEKTQPASTLAGLPATAVDPAWRGKIVDVPITDVALRIEQGVDFTVQADGVPAIARLALKENGLPWGQHLVVWINGERVGVVFPEVPKLGDAGFAADQSTPYVGWREATYFVPVQNLAAGANTLQFSAEPDVAPASSPDPKEVPEPLAVKDVVLQLDYPAPAASVAAATPASPTAPASVPVTVATSEASGPLPDNVTPTGPLLTPPAVTDSVSTPSPSDAPTWPPPRVAVPPSSPSDSSSNTTTP